MEMENDAESRSLQYLIYSPQQFSPPQPRSHGVPFAKSLTVYAARIS